MTATGYREDTVRELKSILHYWMENTPDYRNDGFYGRVDERDHADRDAAKGLVLNSRILWTFSAANTCTGNGIYLSVARRAFEYLLTRFLDEEHGGGFWSLDPYGRPLNSRKQIYGQAFFLFGLSEYYHASAEPSALRVAIDLFRLIEQHGFDNHHKGYYEAFTREWSALEDLRLSEKDANEQKTMNTHLHVIEAYSNLYRSWPDPLLRQRIVDLLEVFDRHIINHHTGHLNLFFTEDWEPRSEIISFGHDIEAAWLLQEAAEIIGDAGWVEKTRALSLQLAVAAAEGLDKNDGGLWYEKEGGGLIAEKHWWPQAEAMVGFLHAWQVSGDEAWWNRSVESWNFVRQYLRAPDGREWYWGVLSDHSPMPREDKAGFWKCPYHNGRACMEIMRRLKP